MEATIKNQHKRLRICLIYRPGSGSRNCKDNKSSKLSCFFEEFESYFDGVSTKDGKLIFCGDFNFHLEDSLNKDTIRFCSLLESRGYSPLTDKNHRATHCSGDLLDAFIVPNNAIDRVDLTQPLVTATTGTASDHFLVITKVKFEALKSTKVYVEKSV